MTISHPVRQTLETIIGREMTRDRCMIARRMRELDAELWQHARLVAHAADQLAARLRMTSGERARLADAAWLHDLGKLTIPRVILDKPGPLDGEEWAIIREHPARAADFLASETVLVDIAPLVRHHHERYDGTGYPDRLPATSIPLGARIIGVVDAFDAMTTERSYRGALSFEAALCELQQGAGSQFDPTITEAFMDIATDLKKVSFA